MDEASDVEPKDEDQFEIEWWGSFSYTVLRDEMSHSFKPICCGFQEVKMTGGRVIRRFHAYDDSCLKKGKLLEGHGPSAQASLAVFAGRC